MKFWRRNELWKIGIILFSIFLLWACSEPVDDYQTLPQGSVVLAFGDSVTHGTGARVGEDYPEKLAEISGWQVINAGIPGDTALAARERLGDLLLLHRPDLVLVELGGNDFLRRRRAADVKVDLAYILNACQTAGAVTVLVGVPEVSLLRATMGSLEDNIIYSELADETGALLVPGVLSSVLSDDELRADRIHPNAQGYFHLARGIAARLREVGLLN